MDKRSASSVINFTLFFRDSYNYQTLIRKKTKLQEYSIISLNIALFNIFLCMAYEKIDHQFK